STAVPTTGDSPRVAGKPPPAAVPAGGPPRRPPVVRR
ncbi:hypothetical protein A2U01_0078971, partial [Trifolium medium]|nr:hypothetical protein [Trifolium medium]